jgi:Spy/CpxP family protein refolding chaperone
MIDLKIALLAAVTAGGAGAFGLGAYRSHAHGGFHGHKNHALAHAFVDFVVDQKLQEIGATDAQKHKVTEIKDRLMTSGKALHGSHAALHERLLALMAEESPDPAQVKALVRERTEAISRFGDEAAEALLELHGTLTPEQRRKLLAGAREHFEAHGR